MGDSQLKDTKEHWVRHRCPRFKMGATRPEMGTLQRRGQRWPGILHLQAEAAG